MKLRLLAISLSLVVGSAANADVGVIGCYTVQASVTAKGVATRIDERSFRLTSNRENSPWSSNGYQVVPAVASDSFSYRSAYWLEDKAKVTVIFTDNGLSGLRLDLHRSPEGLEGTMEKYWDFQDPTDERKVSLSRKPCESFH